MFVFGLLLILLLEKGLVRGIVISLTKQLIEILLSLKNTTLCAKALGDIAIPILERGKSYKAESSKHSSILLTKLDESIEFLNPIFQIGCFVAFLISTVLI